MVTGLNVTGISAGVGAL